MLNEIAVTIIFLSLFFYFRSQRAPKNFPPGATGVPVIGCSPLLGKNPEQTLAQWGWENYGPVFFFTQAGVRTVVLNTLEAAREGFLKQGDSLSGRFGVAGSIGGHDPAAFCDFDPEWKGQRKMRISTLKNLGKIDLDDVIIEQSDRACDEITRACELDQSGGFEAGHVLTLPTFNVITYVIYGRCLDNDAAAAKEAVKVLVDSIYEVKAGPSLSSVLSFCSAFFLGKKGGRESAGKRREGRVTDGVTARRAFLDGFVEKMAGKADEYYDCDQLGKYLVDLFVAGTDSMATVVHWVLVFLAANQKQQAVVRDEIDHVLGKNGVPDMKHYDVMPQTVAAINESYRMRPVFPLSMSHQATDDVTVMGYVIPKGAKVTANLWAIHNDPKYWREPHKFKPQRHIKDGRFVKSDKLIPFSIGPRYCLGSQLATCHNFLFVARLLQRFSFHFPAGKTSPDLNGSTSFVLAPTGIKLVARAR